MFTKITTLTLPTTRKFGLDPPLGQCRIKGFVGHPTLGHDLKTLWPNSKLDLTQLKWIFFPDYEKIANFGFRRRPIFS